MKVIALAKKEAQDCINQPNLFNGCICSNICNARGYLGIGCNTDDHGFLDKFGITSELKVEMSWNLKNSSIANVYELCFLTFRRLNEKITV